MKEQIIEVLAQVMEQDSSVFSDETIIREIDGFDSLQFVMMISELQEKYNIEIPLDRAIEVETLGELIACAKAL
ncbi:acyl carrier protein [Ruminococcus sp.]|uniref:acyl carrier protein n=1 Tax=Ruminococcus sp. TaxID=41978 RepID=UPI0025D6B288|nr:acyl carrier protein [Ruminococcus sp.]